ncbi:MAG: hypothetical protein II938_00335 [Alphaproteobacteria bacterium]|nr:hypothetical protein [Alphaproteobacteria bacterium]
MMKNESGRSMVEMLGVLAIIGVLSVGGIAGYTMAMRKYKANEIMNAASMMAIYCQTNDCTANAGVTYRTAYLNGDTDAKLPGNASAITGKDTSGVITVAITADSADVAKAINDMAGSASGISVNSAYTTNSTAITLKVN